MQHENKDWVESILPEAKPCYSSPREALRAALETRKRVLPELKQNAIARIHSMNRFGPPQDDQLEGR